MSFLETLFSHSILQYALIATLFASIANGVIGSFVVIRRLAFISGGISHSILGGIGFSVWLKSIFGISWLSPLCGALLAGWLSALILGWIHLNYREREDSIIASVWTVGMSLGIVFLATSNGPKIELGNYLIGNILWITPAELWLLGLLNLLILAIIFFKYKKLLTLCFDEKQASLQGVNTKALYQLLLLLIATTVVLMMQIVGAILVITMLIVPATLANLFTRSLPTMILLAILFNIAFSYLGIYTAFTFSLPTGATIALVAGLCYVVVLLTKRRRLQTRG